MQYTENFTQRTLIDAALAHLALERAAASVIQVPDTDPPLFVAVGPAPAIAKLLSDTSMTGAPRALRTAKEALQFLAANPELKNPHEVAQGALKAVERAECGPRAKAALQELADIAQENDMGYGAPKKAAADVGFDESEGGHHD